MLGVFDVITRRRDIDLQLFSCNYFPNISDTWGDTFPTLEPDWDLVIASDILLCELPFTIYFRVMLMPLAWCGDKILLSPADVKQYANLIKTLCFLLKAYRSRDSNTGSGNSPDMRAVTISGTIIILSNCSRYCDLLNISFFSLWEDSMQHQFYAKFAVAKPKKKLRFDPAEITFIQLNRCINPSPILNIFRKLGGVCAC